MEFVKFAKKCFEFSGGRVNFIDRPQSMKTLFTLLAAALFAVSTSHAEIVFGNLGANGTGALSDSGSDFGPSATSLKILAQGFTTGTDPDFLTIQSVSIGAFYDNLGTASRTLSIYSNNIEDNPGTVVATSGATTIGAKGVYTFSFSSLNLSASTSYWVVPQFNQDWFWYFNNEEEPPVGLNASGYSYLKTRRSNNDITGDWRSAISIYSLTITAGSSAPIPEPGTWAAAALLVGGAAFARWRKRQTA